MPFLDQDVSTVAHAIQLAVAPVFLLTGVGALLNVMTNRLGRVIDRARFLEQLWHELDEKAQTSTRKELRILARRARLANWAINLSACAALLICAVVATLFVDVFIATNLKWLAGTFFFAATLALIGGLVSFLREVYLATHTTRIGPPQ